MSMTGTSTSGDGDISGPAGEVPPPHQATPPDQRARRSWRWPGATTARRWTWVIEHAQDVVTVTVGVILIALAVVLLISGIVDFANESFGQVGVSTAATDLVDRVLFVLILLEIVHTVVLSLRAHRLVAQPFIVVGLIAVIRRILLVLTPGTHVNASATQLALYIGMVAVFVAGLIAVSIFEKGGKGEEESGRS